MHWLDVARLELKTRETRLESGSCDHSSLEALSFVSSTNETKKIIREGGGGAANWEGWQEVGRIKYATFKLKYLDADRFANKANSGPGGTVSHWNASRSIILIKGFWLMGKQRRPNLASR